MTIRVVDSDGPLCRCSLGPVCTGAASRGLDGARYNGTGRTVGVRARAAGRRLWIIPLLRRLGFKFGPLTRSVYRCTGIYGPRAGTGPDFG